MWQRSGQQEVDCSMLSGQWESVHEAGVGSGSLLSYYDRTLFNTKIVGYDRIK